MLIDQDTVDDFICGIAADKDDQTMLESGTARCRANEYCKFWWSSISFYSSALLQNYFSRLMSKSWSLIERTTITKIVDHQGLSKILYPLLQMVRWSFS